MSMQVGFLLLAICCWIDCWTAWDGNDRIFCFRATHVIACCHASPLYLMDDTGKSCTSNVHRDMKGDLIGGDRRASSWIENADGSSRSLSSSILPCSQVKSLWTAVSKGSNWLHRKKIYSSATLLPRFSCTPISLKRVALIIKVY